MKHIGFTGTQRGMTLKQKETFKRVFTSRLAKEIVFRHGDCQGADAEAHDIVRLCDPNIRIVIHPPINELKRAFCKGDETLPQKEYLDRNHDIVDNCELLIAVPKSYKQEVRSGTWATVRYAKRVGKDVCVIYPNGDVGVQV